MNLIDLDRRGAPPRNDGLPSTQDLLKDSSDTYLRDLTVPKQADVDLIAVHGLNVTNSTAFAARTWIGGERGEERLWLKDFLPHRLPQVRVLLYAYNSNVAFNTSKTGVGDIAEDLLHKLWAKRQDAPDRPLVFVCHSLGGLVVKRAVVKASRIPRYSPIHQAAKSFAFFATPHRGGFGAEVGQAAAGFIRRLGLNPRTGIMEALRKDSHISPDIHNDFVDGQNNYHICTFYECRPLPLFNNLVVEKSSAVLGFDPNVETRVPCINADHSTICKFAIEDEHYRFVIDEIEELVKWAIRSAQTPLLSIENPPAYASLTFLEDEDSISDPVVSTANWKLPDSSVTEENSLSNLDSNVEDREPVGLHRQVRKGPFFLVPYSQNPSFVGRQGILHYLKQTVNPSNRSQNRVALYGLGGIGKSQVALEYAYWHRLNFPQHSVFWIQANDIDQLSDSLGMVAAHCRLSRLEDTRFTVLDRVRRWLQDRKNGHWLMIVDSVNDVDIFLSFLGSISTRESQESLDDPSSIRMSSYIPIVDHGNVLLTTNNKSTAEVLTRPGHVIEVQPMSPKIASVLLQRELKEGKPPNVAVNSRQGARLSEGLDTLAKQLDCLPLALVQAAAFMQKNSLMVEEYLELIENDEANLTASLDHDIESHGRAGDSSKAVLSTWKIGFDQIEVQCKPAAELLSLMAFFDTQHIPKLCLQHIQTDAGKSNTQSLDTLLTYSFITAGRGHETFDMHRLIQLAMRKRLLTTNTEKTWAVEALSLISEHFPDGKYESWHKCATLFPHALKIVSNDLYGPAEAMSLGLLQSKISWYYLQQGLYEQAETLSYRALMTVTFALGVKQQDILPIKSNRIIILKNLGRLEEAEDLAQEVWRGLRTTLGAKHEDTLLSIATLCLIYQEQGKYVEGERAIRRILKSLGRTLDPDHIEILNSKVRLGTILQYLGNYHEAEQCLREAIEGYVNNSGASHPITLKAYWRLAWICHDEGRYTEAERINSQTWTIQKEVLGPDHPETIMSQNGLSNDLQMQGKFAAAESHKREVYRKAKRLVGAHHRHALTAASSLASCLVASNVATTQPAPERFAEAEDLYQLSLTGREQNLRVDHPVALAARTDLATVRRLRGIAPTSEIEASERETLSKLEKDLGKDHPFTLQSRDNLARALWVQRDQKAKRKEALEMARMGFKARKKRWGWGRDKTLVAADLLLEMLSEGREKMKLRRKVEANKGEVEVDAREDDRGFPR